MISIGVKRLKTEILAAGSLIEQDGKFVFVQEKRGEVRGLWNLPMGQVEDGEDIVLCAEREAQEETGLKIKVLYLIGRYVFSVILGQTVTAHIFKAEIIGGTLNVPDDMMDVRLFSSEEIKGLKLIDPFIQSVIQDHALKRRSPI